MTANYFNLHCVVCFLKSKTPFGPLNKKNLFFCSCFKPSGHGLTKQGDFLPACVWRRCMEQVSMTYVFRICHHTHAFVGQHWGPPSGSLSLSLVNQIWVAKPSQANLSFSCNLIGHLFSYLCIFSLVIFYPGPCPNWSSFLLSLS